MTKDESTTKTEHRDFDEIQYGVACVIAIFLLIVIGFISKLNDGQEKLFPHYVCTGEQHCYRTVPININSCHKGNCSLTHLFNVTLDFNNRTSPEPDGTWFEGDSSGFDAMRTNQFPTDTDYYSIAPYAGASMEQIVHDGLLAKNSLYQEAMNNGKNLALTNIQHQIEQENEQQQKDSEYASEKSNHEVHLSILRENGTTIPVDGYCLDDLQSSGTFINGTEVCGAHTTFSKTYPPQEN